MHNWAYDRITERIVALLKQGTVPWQKPWTAKAGWPRNLVSRKPYRGINVFLLHAMGYESPLWLTFKQAVQLGGAVRKGEKACPVVFWKQLKPKEEKDTGEEKTKTVPLLRIYHVFNVTQCDGLKETPPVLEENLSRKPAEIVSGMPERPAIKHGMRFAFYSPQEDCIGLPSREHFESEEAYFATLFHELVHSTGHEKRLKRSTLAEREGFGSDPYCKEELVAEMGAAYLSAHAEISERTIDNSAAYLQGWLKRLESDPTLIVRAAAQAQKAVDFILGRSAREATEAAV
jgi:antirestriction protein ArdC